MSLQAPPLPRLEISYKGKLLEPWGGWFSQVQTMLLNFGLSGATSARPTTNVWVGMIYFDTTLGYPVFCKTAGATPTWVNASGTSV